MTHVKHFLAVNKPDARRCLKVGIMSRIGHELVTPK